MTIFLNLTKSIEANFKEKVTNEYRDIYKYLVILIDPDKRKTVLDETEEISNIVEFKIYYLLAVLVYKNLSARDILISNGINDIFEKKATEYVELVEVLIQGHKAKDKAGYSDKKIETIGKTIVKYFEFAYHFMMGDGNEKDTILKFKNRSDSNFNILRKMCDDNRPAIALEETFDVFHWIERKYDECIDEETPY